MCLCSSYTMGCLPVRGDNPRAQVIFHAKVGKGGINSSIKC